MKRRTFDAAMFGRAWLAVSIAKSNDECRPILAAVCVSEYPDGIVLTATDSYMAARAVLGKADPSAAPVAEHLLNDNRGHLKALCRDMVKKTREADYVTMWISATSAVIRYGPHRLVLPVVGGVYPGTRQFFDEPITRAGAVVGFNPRYLGRIVTIATAIAGGGPHYEKPLEVALNGPKSGRFAIERDGLRVDALLMPVRIADAEDGDGDLLKATPKAKTVAA